MNLLTESAITISVKTTPDGGVDCKRTIIGSTASLVLALVSVMHLEPDFAEVVKTATRVYADPKSNVFNKKPGK
jgi:hypothetical protein